MSERSRRSIPNNVHLADDNRACSARSSIGSPASSTGGARWGRAGSRTTTSICAPPSRVDREGWAHFDYVKMPDYRWGIFLADPVADRTIGFGDAFGEPVWQQVPGEHRTTLRRLIVTQGDTEPASVEQQRLFGTPCPSLYDLRNLFQVNVEEGRHLWAMVYLLHAYFGRDGREEAEALLPRAFGRSRQAAHPRRLQRAVHRLADASSCSRYFTDRDGKFQLLAWPRARSIRCRAPPASC